MLNHSKKTGGFQVAVIGCGPAGLMAADVLSQAGLSISMFDSMPSAGRKFLIASKGGLNLTHSLPFTQFLAKYRERANDLQPFLERFGPGNLLNWISELGFQTFEGSSGKIFPEDMNAGAILHAIMERLKSRAVEMNFDHKWIGWDEENKQIFETSAGLISHSFDAVVFAFGGASWPQSGSDGSWVPCFSRKEIIINALKPANCGFEVDWSEYFKDHFAGFPIKPVVLSFEDLNGKIYKQRGEFIATKYGVEGNLIYTFSSYLRDAVEKNGQITIKLDLAPDLNEEQLISRMSQKRGTRSISSHLQKSIGFRGIRLNLLFEILDKSIINDPDKLVKSIKSLPLIIHAARPIEEAISTAGGVDFSELDNNLMLRKYPGFFCAGEMLDWEAPTGGFLLTACFSTGFAAGNGITQWLNTKDNTESLAE